MKNQILKAYKKGTFIREGKDLLKEAVKRQIHYKLKYGMVWEFSKKEKTGRAKEIYSKEFPETLQEYYTEQDKKRD